MDKSRRHYCSNTDTYEGVPSEMIIRQELLIDEFKTATPKRAISVLDELLTISSQIKKLRSSYQSLTTN